MKNILDKIIVVSNNLTSKFKIIQSSLDNDFLSNSEYQQINSKIDILSASYFATYQVDWNDFGTRSGGIIITKQNAQKYKDFKIRHKKFQTDQQEYVTNQELVRQMIAQNQYLEQIYDFFQFFSLSYSGFASIGDLSVLADIYGSANIVPNGFELRNNEWHTINDQQFYYSSTSTNGGYGIFTIKLIDPNGKQYEAPGYGGWRCLDGCTKIMLTDRTEKQLKDIQVGDRILGINPQTGQFQQDQVTIVSKHQDVYSESCDIWYFENGTIIKTPKQHRFFNINLNKFEYLNNWNVGDQIRLYDGSSAKLIKHQLIKQRTKCYTLFSKFNSYIANGAICGNRYSMPITPFDR